MPQSTKMQPTSGCPNVLFFHGTHCSNAAGWLHFRALWHCVCSSCTGRQHRCLARFGDGQRGIPEEGNSNLRKGWRQAEVVRRESHPWSFLPADEPFQEGRGGPRLCCAEAQASVDAAALAEAEAPANARCCGGLGQLRSRGRLGIGSEGDQYRKEVRGLENVEFYCNTCSGQ